MVIALGDHALEEMDLLASICRDSFFEFVQEFWSVVVTEKPLWNWHIPYLCSELETLARRAAEGLPKEYDLIINVTPGSTKSTLVCILFPAWVWTWFPTANFIGASYRYDLAMELSRKNRAVVRSFKYSSAFSDIAITEDQDAKGYFINTKGGARMSVGIGGDIIGRHGDFILIDDPLNPKGARSEIEVNNANRFIKETLWSRKKDKAVTPTILIMQRLHQYDPTAMMLETLADDKVKHICLPAELTDDVKPVELREKYVDGLFDPLRLPETVLREARRMGPYFYSGQFLQNPVPTEGGMFIVSKLNYEIMLPPSIKWKMRVRFWDKAGTQGGGAHTAGVLMGEDMNGHFWLLDVQRGQWNTAHREDYIERTAQQDGPGVIIGVEQEPGSSGKESAESTAKRLRGYNVKLIRPTGDKETRADPLSAQVNAGNMYVVVSGWNQAFVDEMTYFPYSKFKDQIDAASGAFNILNAPRIRVGAW